MENRDRILAEASELFFRNGIRSVTMSDVAHQLGISKRTLYETFKDKETLLNACFDDHTRKTEKEIGDLITQSENVIDTMMRIYGKQLQDAHKMNKSVFRDLRKYHPNLYKRMEERQKDGIETFLPLFEKGLQQNLVRDDINFEILLWLLKAQFKMLIDSDFMPTDKFPMNDFVLAIILNFTRGIATPEGHRKIDESLKRYQSEIKNKNQLKTGSSL